MVFWGGFHRSKVGLRGNLGLFPAANLYTYIGIGIVIVIQSNLEEVILDEPKYMDISFYSDHS